MAAIDYPALDRQQKLALFLIAIGPAGAAEVLKQFDEAETEALCRHMSSFPVVDDETQRRVLEELGAVLLQSSGTALGGATYARKAAELALGHDRAAAVMDRAGPTKDSAAMVRDITEMEGLHIYNLVKAEQPQTIAFVLSVLDGAKASALVKLLPLDLRDTVIERLGLIQPTSIESLRRIVGSLGRHLSAKVRPSLQRSGGAASVASILNQLDKDTSAALLAKIEARNAALAAAVRRKMFSFDDLVRLSAGDLQKVMRQASSADLSLAMKTASAALKERIFGALSKRAAENLRDEIQMLGAAKIKDVESAQDRIIQGVRQLEEAGEVVLDSEGAEALVA